MLLLSERHHATTRLDLEPQDRITDKDYFNTENDLMLFPPTRFTTISFLRKHTTVRATSS